MEREREREGERGKRGEGERRGRGRARRQTHDVLPEQPVRDEQSSRQRMNKGALILMFARSASYFLVDGGYVHGENW